MTTKPQPPSFAKSSPDLVTLFDQLAPSNHPAVARKQMFGWPCCFAHGNLLTGLHQESMIFRLSDADRLEFLKLKGTADFEPMPGRKMKGYAIVSNPLDQERRSLEEWIRRSLDFALSLPPKNKAVRKSAKKARKS